MIASYKGHEEIVGFLCSQENINFDLLDNDQNTAMLLAASNGYDEIVFLISQYKFQ